ncbi:MAG: hypothetical protein AAGF26_01565 [Cyanobacteria bacterium P01_G01_bin.49]
MRAILFTFFTHELPLSYFWSVQSLSPCPVFGGHFIIQAAMGWYNCHLHSFSVDGIEYGNPEPSYGLELRDESKAKLSSLIKQEKARANAS